MKNTHFLSFCDFMKSNNLEHFLYQYDNDIISHQYELPINISSHYLHEGDNVLDWSCGNGHFSFYLTYRKVRVTGSSFYDVIPDFLKNEPLFSFKLIDEKENTLLPFADSCFNSVFSIGTLEHVHETGGNQISSLKEIRRVLCPGGYFLCFHLPYKYSWVENIGRLIPNSLRKKLHIGYPHSKRFDKKSIEDMLKQTGFELIDYGLYNFLPRNFTHALPSRLKNNKIFIYAFTGVDKLFSSLLPFLCSQSFFIARKSLD